MTGAERLEQVREALNPPPHEEYRDVVWRRERATESLAGCVLLTAEEAEKVRTLLRQVPGSVMAVSRATALLTPDSKGANND